MTVSPSLFPLNEVRSIIFVSGNVQVLKDRGTTFFHALGALNRQIERLEGNNERDVTLKNIWRELYSALYARPSLGETTEQDISRSLLESCHKLGQYFPKKKPDLGAFSNTDLLLYPDSKKDWVLPLNGITVTGFTELAKLYRQFLMGVKIRGEIAFRDRVLADIRLILSRPLGRDLIQGIVSKMKWDMFIEIRPSTTCTFSPGESTDVIDLSLEPQNLIHVLPNGETMTLKSPSFINLAHELLHALHKYREEFVHIQDSTLHRLDTNREERRTIYGTCGNEKTASCHNDTPINDNALRKQFIGLLPRDTHHSGIAHSGCGKCNFAFAARYGVNGNVRTLFREISDGTLSRVVHRQMNTNPTPTTPQPRASITTILDEAVKTGRSAAILSSMTPTSTTRPEGAPYPYFGEGSY